MFARWRFLLTWMLMAAVPIQGFAAGAMLFCAAATHEVAAYEIQASAQRQHDHSTHTHQTGDVANKGTLSTKAAVADAQHQCSVCAACCHSVGITELPSMSRAASAPEADLADPFVLIVSQPLPLPDKPPRA
jgi:hypothetical protein